MAGALVLVVLWVVALITSYTLGGYIHLLLLPALVIVGLRLVRLRRTA
ncbi:MAG: lmo0937 family membrane protein [Deltaproteobacteria bacterium]|nr:lmo0937 family membrane protein [Deltaproteobacteria bacterium]